MNYETANVVGACMTAMTGVNMISYFFAKDALAYNENPRKIMNYFKVFADPDYFPQPSAFSMAAASFIYFLSIPGRELAICQYHWHEKREKARDARLKRIRGDELGR